MRVHASARAALLDGSAATEPAIAHGTITLFDGAGSSSGQRQLACVLINIRCCDAAVTRVVVVVVVVDGSGLDLAGSCIVLYFSSLP